MVKVNEYFEGKVKSLDLDLSEKKKTVGVMNAGEYEFDTEAKEVITVVSGDLCVYFPEYDEWEDFGAGSTFEIPASSKFKVKVQEDTAYLCEYE